MGKVEDVVRSSSLLGCKIGRLPTSYHGLPFGVLHKYCVVWDAVKEMFGKRLASWKVWYLSKRGRLVLSKSTFSSLSIYFMAFFSISRKVRIKS